MDLGAGNAKRIVTIKFHPRSSNYVDRMVGGKFHGSNTSQTSGYVDLYTIASDPLFQMNSVTITDTNTYRYLRYVGGVNSYCNAAEIEFWTN